MLCRRYDGDNTGNIDDKEMMQALAELGVLNPKVRPDPPCCFLTCCLCDAPQVLPNGTQPVLYDSNAQKVSQVTRHSHCSLVQDQLQRYHMYGFPYLLHLFTAITNAGAPQANEMPFCCVDSAVGYESFLLTLIGPVSLFQVVARGQQFPDSTVLCTAAACTPSICVHLVVLVLCRTRELQRLCAQR